MFKLDVVVVVAVAASRAISDDIIDAIHKKWFIVSVGIIHGITLAAAN
jgi:hypothetical protein